MVFYEENYQERAERNEAISKIPRIKYKNIPESEFNTIQELAKNVLHISKNENNSNEVAITYGMDSFYYGMRVLR